jgi:hypothetical protein
MAHEVVHMQPLHDHDNGVVVLIVQSAEQSVGIPLFDAVARQFRISAPYRSGPSKTWIKVKNPKAATRAIDGTF